MGAYKCAIQTFKIEMDSIMKSVLILRGNDYLDCRLRFMCQELLDLRQNAWQLRETESSTISKDKGYDDKDTTKLFLCRNTQPYITNKVAETKGEKISSKENNKKLPKEIFKKKGQIRTPSPIAYPLKKHELEKSKNTLSLKSSLTSPRALEVQSISSVKDLKLLNADIL